LNPRAQMQMTLEDIMNKNIQKGVGNWKNIWEYLDDDKVNPWVAYPLRLNDCSLVTDGAAMAIITTKEKAKQYTDTPLYIVGTGQGSDTLALHDRPDRTHLRAAQVAAKEAFKMAKLEPKNVQTAEVHDCFTIAEIVAMEDVGFFKFGEGGKAVEEGLTELNSQIPINTSGGLKSKGHPIGASGIGQIVEVFKQMRGEAEGKRQLKNIPEIGLTHNVGGSGGSCTIHIFKR
jgi:acetyl-CoA C-acetyltransferase